MKVYASCVEKRTHRFTSMLVVLLSLVTLSPEVSFAQARKVMQFKVVVKTTACNFLLDFQRRTESRADVSGIYFFNNTPDTPVVVKKVKGTVEYKVTDGGKELIITLHEETGDGRFLLQVREQKGKEAEKRGAYYNSTLPDSPVTALLDTESLRFTELPAPKEEARPLPSPSPEVGATQSQEEAATPLPTVSPTTQPTIEPTPLPTVELIAPSESPKAETTPTASATPLVTPSVHSKAETPAHQDSAPSAPSSLTEALRGIPLTDLLPGGALESGALALIGLLVLIGVLVAMAVKAKRSGLERSPVPFFAGIAGRFLFPILYGLGFYFYTVDVSHWNYRIAVVAAIVFSFFVYRTFRLFPARLEFKQLVFLNVLFCAALFFSFWFGDVGYTLAYRANNGRLFNIDPVEHVFYCYVVSATVSYIAFYNLTRLFKPPTDTTEEVGGFVGRALSIGIAQRGLSDSPLRFTGQALSLAFVPPVIGTIAEIITLIILPDGRIFGSLLNIVVGVGSVHVLGGLFFPRYMDEKHKEGRKVKTFKQAAKEARTQRSSDDEGLYFGSRETAIPSDKPYNVAFASTTGGGKTVQQVFYGQDALKDVGKGGKGGKDVRAFYYDDSGDGYEMLRQMKLSPQAVVHNMNPLDLLSEKWAMDRDFTSPAHALDLATTLFYKGDNESSFYLEFSRGVLAEVIKTFIATKKAMKAQGVEWRWGFTELTDVMSDPAKWERVLEATRDGRAILATVRENNETFTNVKASIQRYMPHYQIIGALWDRATEEISLRKWVEDPEGSIIYVTRPNDSREAVQAINRVLFRSITYFALALPASDTRRIYFFLDELGNAPRWDGLESLALTGRKRGLTFVVGFQEIGSVEVKYGDPKTANQIIAMCQYKWFGKIDDYATQQWASKQIGQHKFTDPTRSESHNQNGPSDSVNFGKKIEDALLGAEFGNFPVVNFKRGVGIWGWYLMPEPVGAFPHEIKVKELTKRLPPMRTDTVNFRPRPEDDQTPREWTGDENAAFWNAIERTQGISPSGAEPELSLEELATAYKTRELTEKEKAQIDRLSFHEKKRFYALVQSSTQEMSLESLAKELLTREPTPDEEARINALSDKERERFFAMMHKVESQKHERATDEPQQNNGTKYTTGNVKRKPREQKSPPVQ